jgi:hypothetical protein
MYQKLSFPTDLNEYGRIKAKNPKPIKMDGDKRIIIILNRKNRDETDGSAL